MIDYIGGADDTLTSEATNKYKGDGDLKNSINFKSENILKNSEIEGAGLGVFAGKDYDVDEIVEINKFFELKKSPEELKNYVFKSHINDGCVLFVCGTGSLFNHSNKNNVYYSAEEDYYKFYAKKPIKEGEEMFINYGKNYNYTW